MVFPRKILLALCFGVGIGCGLQPPDTDVRKQEQYEAAMARGTEFIGMEKYPEAVWEFQRALRYSPDSAAAHSLLGLSYLRSKQAGSARGSLERAVQLDPRNLAALCNLGAVSVMERKYADARAYLEQALLVDPGFALAHLSLGNVLMFMGEPVLARQSLLKAFELDPSLATRMPRSAAHLPEAGPAALDSCLGFARVFASMGNAAETAKHLARARESGFKEWAKLLADKDFDKVRESPQIQAFLK